jgi:ribosomal protein S12 methylthiotransferase
VDEIADEVRDLARAGVREINLVSQDTSAYGRDLARRADLAILARELDRIDDVEWIRLLYLYPDGVSDDLLEAIRDGDRLLPYLDVPIQHATTAMLRWMKRGHGNATLRHFVERIKRVLGDPVLRTAVLVGHPGETNADFEELVAFVEWARFDHLGAFRYSDEEGTPAFGTGPTVSPRDSYNRLRRVMAVQRRISRERNRRLRGRLLTVLVEGSADEQGYVLKGRWYGQAPEVDGCTYLVSCQASPGDLVPARVMRTGDYDIVAEPI